MPFRPNLRRSLHAPLAGSAHSLHQPHPVGPIDTKEIASITVRTRSTGDMADLENFVRAQYARPLARRTYLSKPELAHSHGASEEDLHVVERYAQRHDLVVSDRNAAERKIVLTGTLGHLLDAFPAEAYMFQHPGGAYRGYRGAIHMPRELAGIVTGIFGFDTKPKSRSAHRQKISVFGGGKGRLSIDFAKRYEFPTVWKGKKLDGSGQTIALIELGGGFSHTDLQVYFRENGLPMPNVVSVGVHHAKDHPTKHGFADGEVMLDIEVAGAVVPRANIVVYFGSIDGRGFFDTVNAAVHDAARNPGVISISWGGPEEYNTPQMLTACHEVFLGAAAMGVTICTAAGDHGTADLNSAAWDGRIHVDHPSADDLVLSCGGTQVNAKGEDVVWNDGDPFGTGPGGGGWAGGGGISRLFPVPFYQKTASVPVSVDTHNPGRGVPDVAMSATDYHVRVHGLEMASGGTSAVAPLMSALVCRLNQAKGKNVGFLNPFLYANAHRGITKDVTKGSNAIPKTVPGYEAVQGWDACSGLGTTLGLRILKLL